MKNLFFAFVIITTSIATSQAQVVFGVSPGLGLTSGYIGIQAGDNMVPYLSLQYLGARYKYEEEDFTDEFTGALLVPTLGLKWFVGGSGDIKSYINLAISKPIITGKLEYDGEPDEDFEEAVDNISLLGGELGFGVEYLFSEQFSMGGEFGIRTVSGKFETSDDFGEYSVKAGITPTYSKISLNFYFLRNSE